MSRVAHYCPVCGAAMQQKLRNGRQRPVCPACGHVVYFDPKVAVVAFIEQAGQVLLVQRAIDPGRGRWALPAGFVDHDETPEDAALREVREETGLQARITGLLDVFPKRDEGLADIVIAYAAAITGGQLCAADDAADARWFGPETVPELVFYPSITLVGRWRAGRL